MKLTLFLFAVAPFFVFAQLTSEQEAMFERMEEIDRYIHRAPIFLDRSSQKSLRSTGEIRDESCDEVENPHANGLLTYCTIQFQGDLEVRYRVFGEPQRLHIIRVDIQSSQWNLERDVAVGQPLERVIEALGEPTKRERERLVYSGETEQAIFELGDGSVTRIRLKYYAG
ncbi:hypothetical protein [Aliidiomarina celeris]|uniref:hypothetical protein n=1 Tax=Aliidiomarina celeris TaxID=2249428 RepID=UPI000DE9F2D7|nr:hypothetical protein [Aliidiomarina celeris]